MNADTRNTQMHPALAMPYGMPVPTDLAFRKCVGINYTLVRDTSQAPAYAKGPNYSNAVDLFSDANMMIRPGETVIVPTGVKVQMPIGWGLFLLPRSGLSWKTSMRLPNAPGLIDHAYLDEVGIILQNTGHREFEVRIGDRLAQAVAMETVVMQFNQVERLSGDNRGGGFGSSGV